MDHQLRKALIEAFQPLRVSDVSDGMDWNMLHDIGYVSPAIKAIVPGLRFCGIAKTVRYVPTNRKIPTMPPEEYTNYVSWWYKEVCPYPFRNSIEVGDVIMIDAAGLDVGLLGSSNTLEFVSKGAVGIVSDGGCRDTAEVRRQKCPVWARHISRSMVQGRLEFAEMQVPINVGGALVRPGDVVVGDDDGVIVVPQEKAFDVATYARKELERDKVNRRRYYEAVGLPPDETVA